MKAEITLLDVDKTVHFETSEPIGAPDMLFDGAKYYQLVHFGFRPTGKGVFIWSLVYKPATYMQIEIPQTAQIFKSVSS